MPSLDLVRRHLVITVAVAGLLIGAVAGLFFPIRAASAPKAARETWSLPTIDDTKRFREDAFASLRTARFWKTVNAPGERGTPRVDWTLTAIITRPRPMAVVSQTGGKQASLMVPIGEALPDGSTLLRMTRDAVWFEKDSCVRERRLYRAVTSANNVCLGDARSAAPSEAPNSRGATPANTSQGSGSGPAPPVPPALPAPQPPANATP